MKLFWNESNWRASCDECHRVKTAKEDGAFGNVSKNRRAAELRGRVEELMLNEEEPAGDEWEKEWKEAAGELETIGIREQITGYKHQEGKMKEVAKLAKRLSELTGGK